MDTFHKLINGNREEKSVLSLTFQSNLHNSMNLSIPNSFKILFAAFYKILGYQNKQGSISNNHTQTGLGENNYCCLFISTYIES